jgi:transposase
VRAAEQGRPDVAGKRRLWRTWQRFMDPARFIFLDETATATNMARRYGRSPCGARLVAAVPQRHWTTTTFIAGLRQGGIVAPLVLDGPMTGPAFRAYVEQFLAPALSPGAVVVLDHLAAHKVKGVRQAIAAVGATLLYLPPYSPDLNPIEQLFAKLKALLRQAAARTRDELWQAIGRVLATVPPSECANYLSHCGYGST